MTRPAIRSSPRGNVEAAYGQRLLFANRVTYNQTTGIVTANGDVVLTDPDGATLFADKAQLKDDLAHGVVRGIGMRMADNSALWPRQARSAAVKT